jgi:hypothetical protein
MHMIGHDYIPGDIPSMSCGSGFPFIDKNGGYFGGGEDGTPPVSARGDEIYDEVDPNIVQTP